MAKAILIFGHSNSGKSYLAHKIHLAYQYKTICPHGWIKRQLEELYNIPKGSLETKEFKGYKAPGAIQTMEEMLESQYFFWQQVDPWHTARGFRKVLQNVTNRQANITINGIRTKQDIQVIQQELEAANYEVSKIWISSHCSVQKKTDVNQSVLFRESIGKQEEDYFNDLNPKSFNNIIPTLVQQCA